MLSEGRNDFQAFEVAIEPWKVKRRFVKGKGEGKRERERRRGGRKEVKGKRRGEGRGGEDEERGKKGEREEKKEETSIQNKNCPSFYKKGDESLFF